MIAHLFKRGALWQAKIKLDSWPTERRFSLGTTDRRIASLKLEQKLSEFEKAAVGISVTLRGPDGQERPLASLCEAFLAGMASVQRSRGTLKKYRIALQRVAKECRWCFLSDVSERSFCEWRRESQLRPKTLNDYLNVWMRLYRWLKRSRLVTECPLEFVDLVDARRDAREYRRALTTEEVLRLLALGTRTADGKSCGRRETGSAQPNGLARFQGVSPVAVSPLWVRVLVYRTILETGLRPSELRGLVWGNMSLDTETSSVRVPASISKNPKTSLLLLGPELAAAFRAYRPEGVDLRGKVFASIPRGSTFRRDLGDAGIPFLDAMGRRADLHALRKTFGTALVLSAAEPRVVMEAMRHSDMKLTMKTYMDAAQLQGPVAAAVAKLPWHAQAVPAISEKVTA